MGPLTLFFDRSIGTSIPKALRLLGLNAIHHHSHPAEAGIKPKPHQQQLFSAAEGDDVVLKFAGERNWIVLGQDYNYHLEENVRAAIDEYKVGVFYLWGACKPKWDTMRMFARVYPKVIALADNTTRPFIYEVGGNAQLRRVL